MRSLALVRVYRPLSASAMESAAARRGLSYFSDSKGRILSDEERAKETVYIQKMERERMEKARLKAQKEKMEAGKAKSSEKRAEAVAQ